MIHKNILFANLLQNTKELKLSIPWKKFGSLKDPLLYAKAEVNNFLFFADITYIQEDADAPPTPFYGYTLTIKPVRTQVMPCVYEDSEVFFEGGFYRVQKDGLRWFLKIKDTLRGFDV